MSVPRILNGSIENDSFILEAGSRYYSRTIFRSLENKKMSFYYGKNVNITFVLSSLHFEHSHLLDVIHSQVKRSNYDSAAGHCEKLNAKQDKCHSQVLTIADPVTDPLREFSLTRKANMEEHPEELGFLF